MYNVSIHSQPLVDNMLLHLSFPFGHPVDITIGNLTSKWRLL